MWWYLVLCEGWGWGHLRGKGIIVERVSLSRRFAVDACFYAFNPRISVLCNCVMNIHTNRLLINDYR